MSTIVNCPRCNERTYEKLSTHAYCVSCNYAPDLLNYRKSSGDDLPIPPWAEEALAKMKTSSARYIVKLPPPIQKSNSQKGSAA